MERMTTYTVQKRTVKVIFTVTAYLLALFWYYPERPEEDHENSDQVEYRSYILHV